MFGNPHVPVRHFFCEATHIGQFAEIVRPIFFNALDSQLLVLLFIVIFLILLWGNMLFFQGRALFLVVSIHHDGYLLHRLVTYPLYEPVPTGFPTYRIAFYFSE